MHTFIQIQQELIQELNVFTSNTVTDYQRNTAEVNAHFAREKESAGRQRQQSLDDINRPMKELHQAKKAIEACFDDNGVDLAGGNPNPIRRVTDANSLQYITNYILTMKGNSVELIKLIPSKPVFPKTALSALIVIGILGTIGLLAADLTAISLIFLLACAISIFCVIYSVAISRNRWRNVINSLKISYATLCTAEATIEPIYSKHVLSIETAYQTKLAEAEQNSQVQMEQLEQELSEKAAKLTSRIESYVRETGWSGADWRDPAWRQWRPSSAMAPVTRLGSLAIDYSNIQLPSLPLFIPFPSERDLLLKTTGAWQSEVTSAIQSLILRLFATQPPGMIRFTFIDTAGFGRSIAPFMQLAGVDESLVTGRIWTEASHIEKQLADLSEYITLINQKYLWGPYTTIEEYNEKNRSAPLPYRILVVLGFPYKFTPETARTLVNIAKNGPPCGVCVAVAWDTEQRLFQGFNISELERVSTVIAWQGKQIVWDGLTVSRSEISIPNFNPQTGWGPQKSAYVKRT